MIFPVRSWSTLPRAALFLVLAAGLTAGCEKKEVRKPSPRSSVQVALPAAPSLRPRTAIPRYPDGALSVEGILAEAAKFLGTEVTLRGTVQEVHLCPELEPIAADATDLEIRKARWRKPPACNPPAHIVLTERMGDDRFHVVVAGSKNTVVGETKPGELITVTGQYEQISPDGRFIRQSGLVILPEPPEPEPEPAGEEADAEP